MFNFLKIIIFLLLFIIQISFISALPAPFFNINIIIVGLVIILILSGLENSLLWALVAGILFDMHSFYFYGLNTISLFVALIVANLALAKFFTNRSVYSYILLTTISLTLFELVRLCLVFLFNFFTKNIFYQKIISLNYFISFGYKIIFSVIIIFGSFYFMNYYSRKMKSFFLMPKNEKNIYKKI